MIVELCLMLAAFFLGCIATEIRWITKMRRLSALAVTKETERMGQAESAVPADAVNAGSQGLTADESTEQSLLGLQQHLTETAHATPPEAATRSKG